MSDLALASPSTRRTTGCRLVEWRPVENNSSLVGRCTISFPGGWVVSGIPIFRDRNGGLSAGTPSIPLLDASGTPLLDANSKRRYSAIVTFETKDARQRWNDAVLGALTFGGIT
jgi:hypothetical protein